MKKIIIIITILFSSLSLFSQEKNHLIAQNITPMKIISRGDIFQNGYLYEYQSDFYYIECGIGSISLNLYVGDDADIDLYLYDSDDNEVAASYNLGNGVDETINYNCQPGNYTIEVYCYSVDPDGWDYNYTLQGQYPDPGLPDLIVSSITINATANASDHVVYTKGGDPCSVTVTIQNIGAANVTDEFEVSLLYEDPLTGTEEEIDSDFIYSLNHGQSQQIQFDSSYFIPPPYGFYDVDPSLVTLYAVIDPDNNIEEENENNNTSQETGQIYFVEIASYDMYGCPVGTNMVDFRNISGTYGEARTGHIHNGIDIVASQGTHVHSISSGEIEYHYDSVYPVNSYITMRSWEDSNKRFSYVHIENPQYNYTPKPYRNAGIYICDVRSNTNGAHLHFVDRTAAGGATKNALRSDGMIRDSEYAAPEVSHIKLFAYSATTPNWSDQAIIETGGSSFVINVTVYNNFRIVAKAGDNLGWFHGGTSTYSVGIYSIGYRVRDSQNNIIVDKLNRIVFDSFPSNFNNVYAGASNSSNFYYIVTNTNNTSNGSFNVSDPNLFPNGTYTLEVLAYDIDGNVSPTSSNLEFQITGSVTESEENELAQNILSLNTNYPNPFNPTTTILYSLSDDISNPKIEIYNIKGQKVKTFVLQEKTGKNSVVWNGINECGKKVASGVYLYRLVNKSKTVQTRKMIMLK